VFLFYSFEISGVYGGWALGNQNDDGLVCFTVVCALL